MRDIAAPDRGSHLPHPTRRADPETEFVMPSVVASPAFQAFSQRLPARFLAIGMLGATLGGCLGYDGDVQHGYQLDQAAIADVKVGQTAEQVLVTLGSPSTTSTVGGDAWYYISQRTARSIAFMAPKVVDQHVYAVYFDKGKKVTRLANYGLQDGKVVNFSGGATATVGADNNFIKGIFFNFNPLGGLMSKG